MVIEHARQCEVLHVRRRSRFHLGSIGAPSTTSRSGARSRFSPGRRPNFSVAGRRRESACWIRRHCETSGAPASKQRGDDARGRPWAVCETLKRRVPAPPSVRPRPVIRRGQAPVELGRPVRKRDVARRRSSVSSRRLCGVDNSAIAGGHCHAVDATTATVAALRSPGAGPVGRGLRRQRGGAVRSGRRTKAVVDLDPFALLPRFGDVAQGGGRGFAGLAAQPRGLDAA